jgi:hypothetical protein
MSEGGRSLGFLSDLLAFPSVYGSASSSFHALSMSNVLIPVALLALGVLPAIFLVTDKKADVERGPTPHSWLLGNLPVSPPVLFLARRIGMIECRVH